MALDLLAVANAVAARFAAVTPPAGEPAIQGATALLPNGIPATPYIIVTPPEGELGPREAGISSISVNDTHDFDVYLLISKASGSLPLDLARVYAWWPVMRNAIFSQELLGLGPAVRKAWMVDTYDFDSYEYQGDAYHAWHFTVRVWTHDTVSVTL